MTGYDRTAHHWWIPTDTRLPTGSVLNVAALCAMPLQ